MATYKLKPGQENFEVMSGPDAGKKFVRGRAYEQVPEGYESRFAAIKDEKLKIKNNKPIPATEPATKPEPDPAQLGCAGKKNPKKGGINNAIPESQS